MDIRVFPRPQLLAVLRALRIVACTNDRFTDAERALIEGLARLHDVGLSAAHLPPITLDQLACTVVDPQQRKRAVQLAIVMSLVEGTPSPATEHAVAQMAAALGIEDSGVDVLYEVSHGQAMLARFDMFRRVSRLVRNMHEFPGFGRMFSVMALGGSDAEQAARYHALALCAPGTLGRAVYDHFHDNGFKMPGEAGGIPMVFHDLGHVLSGYSSEPEGEIQQAAFQAGFARNDGFAFLLFGILQFHLDMRITPVAKGERDLFDVPKVLEALHRGASCKVDLSQGYDLFLHKDRPLEEVRAELGIPPLREAVAA
jgi:hypothetical protein